MNPRLLSSDGEFQVPAEGITIGRDSSNVIQVKDHMVSGHHCRIELERDRFVIIDCNSTNGTYLNDTVNPITRAYLEHGDRICVGQTSLRFLVEESDLPPAGRVELDDRDENSVLASETVELNPADSIYLKTEFEPDDGHIRRLARDMSVLQKLGAEISEIDDATRLQNVLLERIFEIIPADNGAILLTATDNRSFLSSPVSKQRVPGGGPIRVSRTITQSVLTSGQSALRNDLLTDGTTPDSVVASRIHSVLCLPLSFMNTRIGVIYLDTVIPDFRFDQQHLELGTAIAGIAAVALEHIRYVEWLESENQELTHEVELRHEMIGQSAKMQAVYEKISLVAPNDNRVVLLGESGTGKELAARAIHKNSNRRNGPFVTVNCGAITESLFMSELFGHVKGAFTGAERDRKGFIEEADGGTLFLDEVGELPSHCQSALLRVVESGEVVKVGSTRPVPVDIRLLSATSRSLKDDIATGRFRSDLFFRLGLPVELPPLRDRLEDIPSLVRFFLQNYKGSTNRDIGITPPDTIRVLQEYSWPGNVRELALAVQWAVVFGKSDRIRPEDLPPEIFNRASAAPAGIGKLNDAKASYERQLILRALEETRGVVSEAAALLDRVPTYLQRRISQLELRDDLKRIRERR